MKKLLLNGSIGMLLMGLAVVQTTSAKDNNGGTRTATVKMGHHDTVPYAKNKGRQSLLQQNAVNPVQSDTTRPDSTRRHYRRSGKAKSHHYYKSNNYRHHNHMHRDTSMYRNRNDTSMYRNRNKRSMSDSMNVRK